MYGKLLKQFTIDTGASQKDVAKKVGFTPQRVNNYYRSIAEPPFEFLKKFREVFSVDLKRLAEKEEKGVAAGVASFNPIPVFDLSKKPSNESDFFNHNELVMYYIDIPAYNDCMACVTVSGAAMSPDYNPGDLIAIKKVIDLDIIAFGEPFFVITSELKLLRYIQSSPDAKRVILRSLDQSHEDMSISKSKILHLFQIKGKITRI